MKKVITKQDLVNIRESFPSLQNLEKELKSLETRISVRLIEPILPSLPSTINYNITAESYFINNKVQIGQQGYYRAPNTQIVIKRLFQREEVTHFNKIIPGYVEVVYVEPKEATFELQLNFFRDNDFRVMYLRGLFCNCCESFRKKEGKLLSPNEIREIYLREHKRN